MTITEYNVIRRYAPCKLFITSYPMPSHKIFIKKFLSGFTVNGTVHEGYPGYYSYSYNPCGWLSLGGDCKRKSKAVVS